MDKKQKLIDTLYRLKSIDEQTSKAINTLESLFPCADFYAGGLGDAMAQLENEAYTALEELYGMSEGDIMWMQYDNDWGKRGLLYKKPLTGISVINSIEDFAECILSDKE